MYEFSRGPLVWMAFAVFFFGLVYRLIATLMLAKKDKVIYPYMKSKFALRSIAHWIVPFGSRNMRMKPAFTILSFLFHICLLLVPIFTLGHVMSWQESWGASWWMMPPSLSLIMTILVVVVGVFFGMRRLADPAVRYVTSLSDFILLIIIMAPFVTGLLAHYQALQYETIMILHLWSGALWLCVIPFTRVVHMLMFPLTRGYMGCEFGYVRHSRDW